MTLGFRNSDWRHRGDQSNNERSDESPEDLESMRKLQFTVASSTFGGIAFVGLFCTCLWLSCCRHKRTTRIRGRTWNTNSSFAVPNGTTLTNHNIYDPHGLSLNPYMITPNYYSDLNSNMNSSMFHPGEIGIGIPDTDDVKPPADVVGDSTYRPFFRKPEWEPPAPPSYDTLGFVNPGYETNPTHFDMDNNHQIKKTLISEKVLTSILATCDPSKRPPVTSVDVEANRVQQEEETSGHLMEGEGSSAGRSSAPPESIVSIESKDGGHPYPDGVLIPKKADGKLEELTPPPFNPSYFNM